MFSTNAMNALTVHCLFRVDSIITHNVQEEWQNQPILSFSWHFWLYGSLWDMIWNFWISGLEKYKKYTRLKFGAKKNLEKLLECANMAIVCKFCFHNTYRKLRSLIRNYWNSNAVPCLSNTVCKFCTETLTLDSYTMVQSL